MNPLATARQLWRLNKDGMLVLMPADTPISAVEADGAIKAGVTGADVEDGIEAAREEHAEG